VSRSAHTEQNVYQEIGQLVPRVRRLFSIAADRRLRAVGETMLAWRALGCAMRSGRCTQRELADAVGQHPAGVCRLLDDFEGRGLVARLRDPHDRRRRMVTVTAAGRRRWQLLLPEVLLAVEHAVAPLSEAERRALRDLLRKLVADADAPRASRR
jgi:DNA-binding MarR family transcriptional regulator